MSQDSGARIQESGDAPAAAVTPQPEVCAIVPVEPAPATVLAPPRRRPKTKVVIIPKDREICTDFAKLEPAWQAFAEELIEKGFDVEDVVEIIYERGGPWVTVHALAVHFQSSLDLQKRRVRQLIKQVDELRQALADPNSTEAQLASATLLLGLVQFRRHSSRLTIKDAHSLRLQRQNLQLRQRVLKMKLAEAARKKSEAHQRYLWEEERRRHLQLENKKLEEILKHLRKDEALPADVMQKIQEIYGIVKEPYISQKLVDYLPKE